MEREGVVCGGGGCDVWRGSVMRGGEGVVCGEGGCGGGGCDVWR